MTDRTLIQALANMEREKQPELSDAETQDKIKKQLFVCDEHLRHAVDYAAVLWAMVKAEKNTEEAARLTKDCAMDLVSTAIEVIALCDKMGEKNDDTRTDGSLVEDSKPADRGEGSCGK